MTSHLGSGKILSLISKTQTCLCSQQDLTHAAPVASLSSDCIHLVKRLEISSSSVHNTIIFVFSNGWSCNSLTITSEARLQIRACSVAILRFQVKNWEFTFKRLRFFVRLLTHLMRRLRPKKDWTLRKRKNERKSALRNVYRFQLCALTESKLCGRGLQVLLQWHYLDLWGWTSHLLKSLNQAVQRSPLKPRISPKRLLVEPPAGGLCAKAGFRHPRSITKWAWEFNQSRTWGGCTLNELQGERPWIHQTSWRLAWISTSPRS